MKVVLFTMVFMAIISITSVVNAQPPCRFGVGPGHFGDFEQLSNMRRKREYNLKPELKAQDKVEMPKMARGFGDPRSPFQSQQGSHFRQRPEWQQGSRLYGPPWGPRYDLRRGGSKDAVPHHRHGRGGKGQWGFENHNNRGQKSIEKSKFRGYNKDNKVDNFCPFCYMKTN